MQITRTAARIVRAAKTVFRWAFKTHVFLVRQLCTAFIVVWELGVLAIGVHVIYLVAVGKTTLLGPTGQPTSVGGCVLAVGVWLFMLASGVLALLLLRRMTDSVIAQLTPPFGEPPDGSDAGTPGEGDASGDE